MNLIKVRFYYNEDRTRCIEVREFDSRSHVTVHTWAIEDGLVADFTPLVSYDTRKRGKAAARWAYRRYVQSNTAEVV